MDKLNLVLRDCDWTVFHASAFESIFKKYFNYTLYNDTITYTKRDNIFVSNITTNNSWRKQLCEQGYRVAIDHLYESPAQHPNFHLIANQNWFWYNQCYVLDKTDQYVPHKSYKKLAFMPIRLRKQHRDQLVIQLDAHLSNMIYSYVAKGIYLPNDMPHDLRQVSNFQQNFNPDWYNETYFSIVAETLVENNNYIFVTEKTFKPIGFHHPFIIFGQAGTLQFIKNLGFETFENLFDESYDHIQEVSDRLAALVKCVDHFKCVEYDTLTLEKIEHNYNLLTNKELVESRIVKEIIEPLIEYAEA